MGEAAAIVVLEELEAARGRGATAIAEVLGFGASNDAYHMTAPRPDGRDAARAIRDALADANLPAGRVGYLNAHGSSTPLNEPAEALAIRSAFGPDADGLAVSGTKGLYGHALGASGAVEVAITALALQREILPGTCNLQTLDPSIDLDVLTDARPGRVDVAVTNSFGFGGMNAVLALGRA
jgi:3-oxoacyl-[acyl-carrier-protein] synthase II